MYEIYSLCKLHKIMLDNFRGSYNIVYDDAYDGNDDDYDHNDDDEDDNRDDYVMTNIRDHHHRQR